MKKTIRTILYAAVFAVLAVSCQKEINGVEPETNTKETIKISINGLMGEYTQVDATKSELVNTVRVSWKAGDVVYVYDGAQCLGSLIASLDGTEDRYALLSTDDTHTVSAPTSGTKLTLVHSPLLTEAPAVKDGAISISLAEQNGTKAPFVAYATLDYNNEESINNALVPFQFATSVIKVNCTGLKANTAIDKATLSNVNTVCKLSLSGDKAPVVAGGTNGTITRTGDSYFAAGKINAEGEAVFQIAVPELETASGARVLEITQDSDEVKDKNFSKKSIDPATSVNTVCQLVGLPVGALRGEFSVGPNATDKVHFSKGNLVATIDANGAPTAWNFATNQFDYIGEGGANKTIGNTSTSGTAGDVDLFGWSASNNGGTSTTDNYGIKTSTSTSDYSGDFYDWGKAYCASKSITPDNTWRMLSTAEWQYLFNTRSNASNLYKGGVTVCGKTNCVVLLPDNWQWDASTVGTSWQTEYPETSTESNPVTWERMEKAGAVCLPAAGYRFGSNVYNVGGNGCYWSSAAYDEIKASSVYFNSLDVDPDLTGSRYFGFSVRLITE